MLYINYTISIRENHKEGYSVLELLRLFLVPQENFSVTRSYLGLKRHFKITSELLDLTWGTDMPKL